MTGGRHLCLSCFEDWADFDDLRCLACSLDHQRTQEVAKTKTKATNRKPVDWYGPTLADIRNEELAGGIENDDKAQLLPWGFSEVV